MVALLGRFKLGCSVASSSLLLFLLLLLLSLLLFLRLLRLGLLILLRLFRSGLLRVDGLTDLHRTFLELLERFPDLVSILSGHRLVQVRDVTLNLILNVLRDLVLVLDQLLLNVVDLVVGLVLHVDCLTALHVSLLTGFGVIDHVLDIVVAQTDAGSHSDGLGLTSALVLGRHIQDAVRIDIEGNLNLRDASRCHGDTAELEVAHLLVISGHFSLTLKDSDADLGLVIGRSREDL
jgi:hypothetical protein